MSMLQQLRAKDLTPRTIVLSVSLFVLATTGIMAVVVKGMTGSPATGTVKSPRHVNAPASFTSTPLAAAKVTPALTEQDYTVIVKRNLFHPLETVTIAAPPPVEKVQPPQKTDSNMFNTQVRDVTGIPAATTTSAPQVAFTGLVNIGGEQYALLESLDDHLSQYTRLGSTAFGYKLVGLAEKSVTLEIGGETLVLNIGDNKQEEAITPPKAAAPTTANPAGGPGFTGNGAQNGAGPGGNPNGGGFRRRQRGQTTTGEG